jgi:hypothetical protein
VIILDGYGAWHGAVAKLKAGGRYLSRVRVRSCRHLNKRRRTTASADQIANPANDGFKRFDTATVTIRGIELAEKIKER